jgi:heme exporter protein C
MRAGTVVGGAAVLLLGAAAYAGLVASPPDAFLGEYVRIMYAHVPTAWAAYLAVATALVGGVLYLRRQDGRYDAVTHSATELAVLFTGLTLATGSIWGRPVWGVWWTWDARLVTTALLFLIYSGALLVRALADDPRRGARLGAVVAILGAVDVPVIHYSVAWFRTLHQPPSITRGEIALAPPMLLTLLLSLLAFTVLFSYLLVVRVQLARLEGAEESG